MSFNFVINHLIPLPYSPDQLALMLSRRCNIECPHCIVDAGTREIEKLDFETIDWALDQAKELGFKTFLPYGGEPFLYIRDLLPYALDRAFEKGFTVAVGTNGFWGKTEHQAHGTMKQLDKLALQHDQQLQVSISVDQYHQPQIPVQSIVNIIRQFRLNDFSHLTLGVQTFADEKSWSVLGEVYKTCRDMGIFLVETNNGYHMYPALQEELIEFCEENYTEIKKRLDLPTNAGRDIILQALYATQVMYEGVDNFFEQQAPIVSRKFDIGNGEKNYLIFTKNHSLIDFIVEDRVIHAGRAQGNEDLELFLEHGMDTKYLIIAPDRRAYAYPAQVTSQEGVDITGKSLSTVMFEVGRKLDANR